MVTTPRSPGRRLPAVSVFVLGSTATTFEGGIDGRPRHRLATGIPVLGRPHDARARRRAGVLPRAVRLGAEGHWTGRRRVPDGVRRWPDRRGARPAAARHGGTP